MVKRRERTPNTRDIEKFASAAEPHVKAQKTSKQTYKRLTFSLTEREDALINELSLKPRTFRCSRSKVVTAAVAHLATLSDDEIVAILEKTQKD
ncbi:hypothetical protein BZJ17_15010 [Salinivibrio sp. IB574]|uniref:hypothetical protein n=1 Tax=Salinivibrio sp. IB574 TaxID=1909444 RepID=UPI0009895317|nr:hypothetical protein [Salinivibrio sp. IB574]OOF19703.1 hypothetical protein BZJ17_15010 [Salinivibrio sp. IB574]